jgi:hypothetical protein
MCVYIHMLHHLSLHLLCPCNLMLHFFILNAMVANDFLLNGINYHSARFMKRYLVTVALLHPSNLKLMKRNLVTVALLHPSNLKPVFQSCHGEEEEEEEGEGGDEEGGAGASLQVSVSL